MTTDNQEQNVSEEDKKKIYEAKKKYVLTLLNAIQNTRPVAKGLIVLIESNSFTHETLGTITDLFKDAVENTIDEVNKQKLQNSISYLEKLQEMEKNEEESDEELDDLLKNL